MFKKILVGYEGSEQSEDALSLARELAGSSGDVTAACSYWSERLTARVGKGGPGEEAMRPGAVQTLAPLAERGIATVPAPGASPAAALHDLAELGDFDLVVLGSTHHGRVAQVLVGSTATHLLHGAPCAVAVAPLGYRNADHASIKRVAVAYVDTPAGHEALHVAYGLADERAGSLVILDAADRGTLEMSGHGGFFAPYEGTEVRQAVADELQEALTQYAGRGDVPVDSHLLLGAPGEQLVEYSRDVDVLVMGSRGFGGLRRAMLGSVSAYVVHHAACPVLVVPRGVHLTGSTDALAVAGASG